MKKQTKNNRYKSYQKLISNLSILSLFSLIFVSSCFPKPLDIELEQAPVKMVIASQIVPNSIMVVAVSRSFGALDYSEDYDTTSSENDILDKLMVKDAKVTISYMGITDDLLPIDDLPGIYASATVPQFTNVEYTLNVYNPETGKSVSSKASMLNVIPFDSISAKRGEGDKYNDITVSVSFTDPPDELNWYMINFYTQEDTNQSVSPFEPQSPNQVTILLSDEGFESSKVSGERVLYNWTSDTLVASISNISHEYYNYLSARKRGGNLFSSIVSEPINYPSNIKDGYGFFTTHFPDIKIIILE